MYIAFEGVIGAGKTTLARILADRFRANLILENFEDNPFLARFYAAPQRWGLAMQLWFLADRSSQLAKVDARSVDVVADHTLHKDKVFATTILSGDELSLYDRYSQSLRKTTEKPSVIVLLDARDDILLARIKNRGRAYESHISVQYLDSLRKSYDAQFETISETVVRIDTSNFDLNSAHHITALCEKIEDAARGSDAGAPY